MYFDFTIKVLFIYLIGFLLAILEIQIEGKEGGWAKNLPTWRPHPEKYLARIFHTFTKKELTGYHLTLWAMLLVFLHMPFLWGYNWSWLQELEILAFYAVVAVFWDFLWFVLNPHYSLKDFGPKQVWWHKKWLGRFPTDYYFGIFTVIILFIPSILLDPYSGSMQLLLLLGGNIGTSEKLSLT